MNYSQTLEFLFSQLPAYHRIGKAAYRNDLKNTILLDNYFRNPHRKYPTIHIAGTNGKGSVSHMIASVLQEAGYKTGLYTSPHLKDFRERIRINGKTISEDKVISFVELHRNIIESLQPSFFEMTVGMAFNYFAENSVDIAVIEVGLGGRLDSTNIINPVLSVITNIGHDHMDLLGDSLEKIAVEKSGIIKNNVPVVVSETQCESEEVFRNKAMNSGSSLLFADQQFTCKLSKYDITRNDRSYLMDDAEVKHTTEGTIPLPGDYQAKNLQAVYAVFSSLKGTFRVTEKNMVDGVKNVIINTGLAGRWQILGKQPLTICDTGHNREGLEYVLRQIKQIPKTNLHMIIGFVNDKDLASVLPLFPKDAVYYFTRAMVPRALDEKILLSEASRYGLTGKAYHDVVTALESARINAVSSDLIFIGGSTFVVAEII